MKLLSFIPSRTFAIKALKLIIPIALGQMLVATVSFVDQFMVGNINVNNALTAVLVANEIMYIAMGLNLGIALVGDIFGAQFFGAKMVDKFQSVTKLKVVLNLIVGLLIVGLINLFPYTLIRIFINDPTVITITLSYLRFISIGHLMYAITVSFIGSLNIIGKPRYQLIASLIFLLFNVLFNFIFMYLLNYQVDGAAYSTLLARILELFLILIFVYRSRKLVWFGWKLWIWDLHVLKAMSRRFLIVTSQVAFAIGLIAKTAVWTNYYPDLTDAFGIGYVISGLLWATFPGFSSAAKIIIGQRMGRNDFKNAFLEAKQLLFLSIITSIILGILVLNFAFWLPQIVGLKNLEINAARDMIIIESILIMFIVVGIYCFSLLEAGGFSKASTFLNSYYILIVVFPLAIILSKFWHPRFVLVFWLIQIIHFVGVGFISLPFFFRKKWLRNITTIHPKIIEPHRGYQVS